MESINALTRQIIGSAITVHRALGPGLLESAYQECLLYELRLAKLDVQRELKLPIIYKEVYLDYGYRIDLLVEGQIVLELKAVEKLHPVHKAQVLTYLKLGGYPYGLLINFNEELLKNGIRRFIMSSFIDK